ncbi:MAG: preprotein translocase subunit YajC [Myxococcota bacterium]
MVQHLAQALIAQAEAPAQGFDYTFLITMGLMFGVFYLLLIRPASQQRKKHQELLNQLKKGDEVQLNGGMYGKIVAIQDDVATVDIANNVKVRVLRERIVGKWPTPNAGESKSANEKSASK